jgi:predicted enzyme related to lactoylglutathione lyase
MPDTDFRPIAAAAVIYARDAARVARFYRDVCALAVVDEAADHLVLESRAFQLVVLAAPAAYTRDVAIASPPVVREQTPIKLVFVVADIPAARAAAAAAGGAVKPAAAEWAFQGHTVCDGHDPEGNVFQLRAPPRAS